MSQKGTSKRANSDRQFVKKLDLIPTEFKVQGGCEKYCFSPFEGTERAAFKEGARDIRSPTSLVLNIRRHHAETVQILSKTSLGRRLGRKKAYVVSNDSLDREFGWWTVNPRRSCFPTQST